jgi:peptidoglycan/xylan/chitin deacetylase (PgdA/CDA1 family)
MGNARPLISFTFDDVPASSCTRGREILEGFGIRATYFLALSLMDSVYEIGTGFSRADLAAVVAGGHEIGSHTFGHLDAWATPADRFEESLRANQRRLDEILPGKVFRTFSYPLNTPHPRVKKIAGDRFLCCRGGGQAPNVRTLDRRLLKSYFVDARNRDDLDALKAVIGENGERSGWLIFSTHDIDDRPSAYGCTPRAFEDLARAARGSGAEILPVEEAWAALGPAPV